MVLLRDLCETMLHGSLCAMGGMTPYPVLSALNHYPQDFGLVAPVDHAAGDVANTTADTTANTVACGPPCCNRGTPARRSTDTVSLQIDGFKVTVPKGSSLMRAATDAGIRVPKLCATDSLEHFGSCRPCLVEIAGRKGYPSSCTTPTEAGMVGVRTQSLQLQTLRQGVMELTISDHPLDGR